MPARVLARLGRFGAAGAALALALLGLIGFATPAHAHSELTGSTPENGARLTQAPTSVTLSFNEQVPARMAHLTLTRPGSEVEKLVATEGLRPTELVAALPTASGEVPAGDWVIGYRVTSADGHPVQGEVTFSVGLVGAASPSATPSPADAANTGPTSTPNTAPSASPTSKPRTINTTSSDDDNATLSTVIIGIIVAVPTALGCLWLARGRRRDQES